MVSTIFSCPIPTPNLLSTPICTVFSPKSLLHCRLGTANMSPKVICNTDSSKLNKCVTLQTEDTQPSGQITGC